MARRSLRQKGTSISFFAFQDIITSVSGILIVITLILALSLGSANPMLEQERATAEQEARLAALLDQLSTLRHQTDEAAAARGRQATPEELAARAAQLRAEVAALAERNARLRAEASDMLDESDDAQRAAALARVSASLVEREAEIRDLEAAARARAALAEAAARAAEEAQAAALAEQARKNVLRLIPEPSANNREPVIVVLAAKRWTLQRFDTQEKTCGNSLAEFRTALGSLSALKQYIVYYGKPSGADDFDVFLNAARNANFDVGYDLIPEETAIELHPK